MTDLIREAFARLQVAEPPDPGTPPAAPPVGRETRILATWDTPPADVTPRLSVAEARDHIAAAIDAYLEEPLPGEVLLVRVSAGVGKTHRAVRTAERLARTGKRVLYAGPRHDFFDDIKAIAEQPQMWYEWQPRQPGTDDKQETCRHAETIKGWVGKGYDAMKFCSGVCGWTYIAEGCPWHAQKKRAEPIIFGQHAHLIAHPLPFEVVIGDENPVAAFLHEWSIQAKNVFPVGMDPTAAMTHIVHTLTSLTVRSGSKGVEPLQGPALLAALGGAQYVLDACRDFGLSVDAEVLTPDVHRPEDAEGVPPFHLPMLVGLLAREAECHIQGMDYLHRVIVAKGHLNLLLRRALSTKLPQHIIWLDATGEPRIYEAIFGRPVRVIDAHPRLKGRVYQLTTRAHGKGALLGDGPQAERWRGQLREVVDAIKARGYERPAIVTFQGLVDNYQDMETLHFYAGRGTNRLEGVDCLMVVGTPQPHILDVTKAARMIFFERNVAFNENWTAIQRRYNYRDAAGQGRSREVGGYWADPDLEAVLWSMREAEIIQAVHRARPVQRETDVWLLSNVPIDQLPPTELLDFDDIFQTPDPIREVIGNPFVWHKIERAIADLESERQSNPALDITVALVAERAGISGTTVRRVWELLPVVGHYDLVEVRGGRGRPKRALIRKR